MRTLIAFPLMAILVILQSSVVSQVSLLSGYADIVLVFLAALALQEGVVAWHWAALAGLMVGYVSGVPWPAVLGGYLLVAGLAWLLQRRIWEAPLLATFVVIFIGTLLMHLAIYVVLRLTGNPLGFGEAFGQITLPSLLLNLLLAVPVYPLARDLAAWVYPVREIV